VTNSDAANIQHTAFSLFFHRNSYLMPLFLISLFSPIHRWYSN